MDRVSSILISVVVLHLLTDTVAVVTRAEWGSAPRRGGSYISGKLDKVFIHHTAGPTCYSLSSCKKVVKGIQDYHVKSKSSGGKGWADIGYSFLVGQDGRVYEGRGWHRSGAHTLGYNFNSYGIAFMGNFVTAIPNDASLKAVSAFLDSAVPAADKSGGTLTSTYTLRGHKDVGSTACPGTKLYDIIKEWSHYDKT